MTRNPNIAPDILTTIEELRAQNPEWLAGRVRQLEAQLAAADTERNLYRQRANANGDAAKNAKYALGQMKRERDVLERKIESQAREIERLRGKAAS